MWLKFNKLIDYFTPVIDTENPELKLFTRRYKVASRMLWNIIINLFFIVVFLYLFGETSSIISTILITDMFIVLLGMVLMYVFHTFTAPILFAFICTVFLMSYGMLNTGGLSSPFSLIIISLPISLLTFGAMSVFVFACLLILVCIAIVFLAQFLGLLPPLQPEILTQTEQFILFLGAFSYCVFGGIITKKEIREVRIALRHGRELAIMEARIDMLTNLLNRRAFTEEASKMLEREERNLHTNENYQQRIYLALIDIDFFKKVNDQFGHAAGDNVLIDVANSLKQSIRKFEILARIGGEEFVILYECDNQQSAADAGERIRKNVEALTFQVDGKNVQVTISVGITARNAGENLDVLLSNADVALYKAKDTGRNRVVNTFSINKKTS